MSAARAGIVRFANQAEAISQGWSLPDKRKDKDISPYPVQDMAIKYQNAQGQISQPVWLDDAGKVVQMFGPK